MVIALRRCWVLTASPNPSKIPQSGSSTGEEPATEDYLRNGMESKWSGWVLILSLCLGSYQGKARPGDRT